MTNLRIILQHGSIKKSTTTPIHHDIPCIQQDCPFIRRGVQNFIFRHSLEGFERATENKTKIKMGSELVATIRRLGDVGDAYICM